MRAGLGKIRGVVASLALVFGLTWAQHTSEAHEPHVPRAFVQVRTTIGVTIELDGKIRGVVENNEGLVLRDVEAGVHRIRAWLVGHEDQSSLVRVEAGTVNLLRLRPWQPVAMQAPVVEGEPAKIETGVLVVEAIASQATLDARKLGWKKIALDGDAFVANNVPAGTHKLTFCNPDKCIDYRAQIRANEVLGVVVDFAPGQVHDVTIEKRELWSRWRTSCATANDREACQHACNVDLALAPFARSASCDIFGLDRLFATSNDARLTPVSALSTTPPCSPIEGAKRGWITIMTSPSSELFWGEQRLGMSPLTRVELPAGCVELRALNRDRGVDKRVRVDIESGAVTVYNLEL